MKDVVGAVPCTCASGVHAAHPLADDHQANGGVEQAVRDVKDHIRVILCVLSRRTKLTLNRAGSSAVLRPRLGRRAALGD